MGELQGIARFTFHPGAVEEFKRLSVICMDIARTEEVGTLQYEIYVSADESECIVLERYRDSEALREHLEHVGAMMDAIMATASVSGALLGEPHGQLRQVLADVPVRLFAPYAFL